MQKEKIEHIIVSFKSKHNNHLKVHAHALAPHTHAHARTWIRHIADPRCSADFRQIEERIAAVCACASLQFTLHVIYVCMCATFQLRAEEQSLELFCCKMLEQTMQPLRHTLETAHNDYENTMVARRYVHAE